MPLSELVEARCPWDVVKRHFPDLDRVELVVSVNEYDEGRLSRWLEIYGNGDRWHISLKPKWIDEVLSDGEARAEMKRQGVVDIMCVAASVAHSQKGATFCGCNRRKFVVYYLTKGMDRHVYHNGSYPDVVKCVSDEKRRRTLKSLCSAYLFKDVLKWQSLKNSDMLGKLVKALALQVGGEVSYKEVGDLIGIDNETVGTYVERLEKAFVVFRLPAFSRNIRNELKKSKKIYFCDTGIRNAVIGNFLPLDSREDTGHLFENYVIAERLKNNRLRDRDVQTFFWRVKGSGTNEIDYLEESAEKGLVAYEFKWNPAKAAKSKCPKVFAEAYPDARWQCISRENYVEFVTGMI